METKNTQAVYKKILRYVIENELKGNIHLFQKELENINILKGCKYPIIDAHVHMVDFNQKTMGLKTLLKYMDASNIVGCVIFWIPVIKMWQENERQRPNYYLDDDNPCYYYGNTDVIVAKEYLSLTKEEQKRFFPLLCGFNPMDMNSIEHIITMYQAFPWVFCGIGEVFYRHDDLTHMTYGDPPRMNTKATRKLFEFIIEYDLPLCIHNNITAPGISDYPKFLYEMEEVLRQYPKAKVVFAHCGASRRLRAPYYTHMIQRLLTEYPNLYVDFSWVIYDEFIAISCTSLDMWVELTEQFYDRVMIGSDVLWNQFHQIGIVNHKYNIFLDKLTPKTREHVCIKNALRIYGTGKNRFEKNKKRKYPSLQEVKEYIAMQCETLK